MRPLSCVVLYMLYPSITQPLPLPRPHMQPIHDMLLNGLCQVQPLTSICVDVTVSLFGKSTHIVGKQYRCVRGGEAATRRCGALVWQG